MAFSLWHVKTVHLLDAPQWITRVTPIKLGEWSFDNCEVVEREIGKGEFQQWLCDMYYIAIAHLVTYCPNQ